MSTTTARAATDATDLDGADARPAPTPALRPGALGRQLAAAVRLLLVLTVLLGGIYPLGVWAVSQLPGLHAAAEGSLLGPPAAPTGSSLVGVDPVPADPAADPWFHTRPSASSTAPDGLGPADPSTSGGSNRALDDDQLRRTVEHRRAVIAAREGALPAAVPPDAVTASGSGLDPHISPAYAVLQVPRVARVTGLGEPRVRDLVAAATDPRPLGFLGEPGVDVPVLDGALARAVPGIR